MEDKKLILHKGIYKKSATVGEAVFMITGMTIGAGILGLPYVIAQVGIWAGLVYIICLGLVMLCLNLMIGEIAVRTKNSFQLSGFAGKYLGPWAKRVLSVTVILSGFGTLLAYIIGEGQALAALLGGNPLWWSIFFWSVGSFIIWRGLQTIKRVEKILSLVVMSIIVGLSLYLWPHMVPMNFYLPDISRMFLPFGVILFALHASPAIAEVHALLPGSQRRFKKAVIIGTIIPICIYILFALTVVGVSGGTTTEVATVGLGEIFGQGVLIAGNLFAVLAMGAAFMGMGMALKQTFVWDHKLPKWVADYFVIAIPLLLFLVGFRSFITVLSAVGGVFVGIEAIFMVLIFWKARRYGEVDARRYESKHFWLLVLPVFAVFTFSMVFSIVNLLVN